MNTPGAQGPKDPERTLQALFGSMSGDAPRPGAKQATLAALGLSAAAATVAGTAGALGTAGMVAKFVGLGVLAGVVTTGAVVGVRHGLSPAPPNHAHPTAASTSTPRALGRPHGPQRTPAAVPSARLGDRIQVESTPATPAAHTRIAPHPPLATVRVEPEGNPIGQVSGFEEPPPVAAGDAWPAADSSLRGETAQLDRARSAMAAGNAQAGLAELDRYHSAFPRGALGPEAALLRIKALVMTGDRAGARALARSFATSHPASPHLEQLRSLLEP
ncbi:MAG: hypothetical protein JW940_20440 [Polyangiaceae bacterium]|nr:hypothetical protein [Polyangiaceae bacterium]